MRMQSLTSGCVAVQRGDVEDNEMHVTANPGDASCRRRQAPCHQELLHSGQNAQIRRLLKMIKMYEYLTDTFMNAYG